MVGSGTMHSGAIKTRHAAPTTVAAAGPPPKLLDRLRVDCGHATIAYTHVLNRRGKGVESSADALQEESGGVICGNHNSTQDVVPAWRNMLSLRKLRAFPGRVLYSNSSGSAPYCGNQIIKHY